MSMPCHVYTCLSFKSLCLEFVWWFCIKLLRERDMRKNMRWDLGEIRSKAHFDGIVIIIDNNKDDKDIYLLPRREFIIMLLSFLQFITNHVIATNSFHFSFYWNFCQNLLLEHRVYTVSSSSFSCRSSCVSLCSRFSHILLEEPSILCFSLSLSLSVSFLHSSCHLHIFDAKSVLRRCDTLFSVDFVSSSSETVCLSYARFFLLWKECQHRIGSCVTSVMCCQKYVVVVVVSTEKSLIIRRWRRGNEGKRRSKKRASMYE